MAGPFPGMDPYLESPVLWPGVHQGIIGGMRATLNTLLPPGYVADMGERVYVMQPDRNIYPDVVVFEQPSPTPVPPSHTSVVAVADPPTVLTVEPVEVREVFIQILPVGDETRVVTVIEVLSYVNKARGSEGRELYLLKQRELLESAVNLIEIDLLRRGEHSVAVPRESLWQRKGRWDYLVCLHRSGQRGRFETCFYSLRDRLPRINIPLENGLPDVVLDLQAVFDRNYDEGAYARRVDYAHDPPTPLEPEDAAWADALLRSQSFRT